MIHLRSLQLMAQTTVVSSSSTQTSRRVRCTVRLRRESTAVMATQRDPLIRRGGAGAELSHRGDSVDQAAVAMPAAHDDGSPSGSHERPQRRSPAAWRALKCVLLFVGVLDPGRPGKSPCGALSRCWGWSLFALLAASTPLLAAASWANAAAQTDLPAGVTHGTLFWYYFIGCSSQGACIASVPSVAFSWLSALVIWWCLRKSARRAAALAAMDNSDAVVGSGSVQKGVAGSLSRDVVGRATLVTDRLSGRTVSLVVVAGVALLFLEFYVGVVLSGLSKKANVFPEPKKGTELPIVFPLMSIASLAATALDVTSLGFLCTGALHHAERARELSRAVIDGKLDNIVALRASLAAMLLRAGHWTREASPVFFAHIAQFLASIASVVADYEVTHTSGGDAVYVLLPILVYQLLRLSLGFTLVWCCAQQTTAMHRLPLVVARRAHGVQDMPRAWSSFALQAYTSRGEVTTDPCIVDSRLGRDPEGSGNGPSDLTALQWHLTELVRTRRLGFRLFGVILTWGNVKRMVVSVATITYSALTFAAHLSD